MKINAIQNLIDIIRLKKLKTYLNNHPTALEFIINFLSLFKNGGNQQKIYLLRFSGAQIGEHVCFGDNIYIQNPQNLRLDDYVQIGTNKYKGVNPK